jgi:hypothetical protein
MTTPLWFAVVFWMFSLLASAFYGWKAFEAFAHFAERDRWFRVSVTDVGMLHE